MIISLTGTFQSQIIKAVHSLGWLGLHLLLFHGKMKKAPTAEPEAAYPQCPSWEQNSNFYVGPTALKIKETVSQPPFN